MRIKKKAKPVKKGRPISFLKKISMFPAAFMLHTITAFCTTPVMRQPIKKAQKVRHFVTVYLL